MSGITFNKMNVNPITAMKTNLDFTNVCNTAAETRPVDNFCLLDGGLNNLVLDSLGVITAILSILLWAGLRFRDGGACDILIVFA